MHAGEVKRNPYHLRLPAWMMDNVRRGSEVIAGPGSEASHTPMEFSISYSYFKTENSKHRNWSLKSLQQIQTLLKFSN